MNTFKIDGSTIRTNSIEFLAAPCEQMSISIWFMYTQSLS